ncbi:MAG: TraR/DksA C4-type zinc finger protein [Bacteroidia bacterium]|nr:TraR/DksA C4-type zinc finger protein [Bacteroidia bacterium]
MKEIDITEKTIEEYKEQTKPIALDRAVGRLSRMDAINNKSVTEAALRQAESKLIRLKHVLSQVDKEGFGLCAKCKSPIPIGRIFLVPQTSHCVNCAV